MDGRFSLRGWSHAVVDARPRMAGFAFARMDARKKSHTPKRRRPACGGPSSRIFRGNLQLRAGPPTVGVIVRAIVVDGRHEATRGRRGGVRELGGHRGHVPTRPD